MYFTVLHFYNQILTSQQNRVEQETHGLHRSPEKQFQSIITFSQSYYYTTRPKPVDHGYVFSMAVGTIGEWLKLVPFLLGDVQLIQLTP